jgi:hypothetical protein
MLLVRAWRRQLLGGLGAALIVPVSLLAALAVLAFAGGFAGLGALGQAFSGPSLTTAGQGGAPAARPTHTISTAVPPALAAPHAGPPAATGALLTGGDRRNGRAAPRSDVHSQPRGGAGSTSPVPAPTGPAPSPAPTPHPTLTDEVIGTATTATSQLPAPAGPAATGALQAAGSTVDRALPLPAPGPPNLP